MVFYYYPGVAPTAIKTKTTTAKNNKQKKSKTTKKTHTHKKTNLHTEKITAQNQMK